VFLALFATNGNRNKGVEKLAERVILDLDNRDHAALC
jgi:hypothetical protein